MIKDDTWYRCTICDTEGYVGRCCGKETRVPCNQLAFEEQKQQEKEKINACKTCWAEKR